MPDTTNWPKDATEAYLAAQARARKHWLEESSLRALVAARTRRGD